MFDAPFHLLYPLASSLLFVLGVLSVKRATLAGVSTWTITFLANQIAAVLFASLWFQGGQIPPIHTWWPVVLIAILYISGQCFTFAAIQQGDVSVATPIFGTKVILVTLILGLFCGQRIPAVTWIAAALATVGIALVQLQNKASESASSDMSQDLSSLGKPQGRLSKTIGFALAAAASFATFDVLVQMISPNWGAGRLLPILFGMVAILSCGFLPWVRTRQVLSRPRWPLWLGGLLVALQALSLVYSLATFQDAARINVVYSTRALWGVLLAWGLAKVFGGAEAELPRSVMLWRTVGASMLMLAVILVLMAGSPETA